MEGANLSKSKRRTRSRPKSTPFGKAKILLPLAVGLIILLGGGYMLLAGSKGKQARDIVLAPLSQMPTFVQTAPRSVQEAYRFAVANPNLLEQMPCYCGCGKVRHDDNIDCYVKTFNQDGSVARFDNHAAM
jgi:hypothetical protein